MGQQENKQNLMVIMFYVLMFVTPLLAGDNFQLFGGEKTALFIWMILVTINWAAATLSGPAGFRELVRFKYLVPLFLFFLWLVLSAPFATVIHASIQWGLLWGVAILLPLTAVQLRLSKQQIYNSLFVLMISAALVAVYGVYQAIWGFASLAQAPGLSADDIRLLKEVQRPFAFLPGPNVFGGFLVPFIPVAVVLFVKCKSKWPKILSSALLVPIIIGLLFSYSKGAWLVALGSIVLLSGVLLLQKDKKVIWILAVMIIAVPLFFFLKSNIDDSRDQLTQTISGKLSTISEKGNYSIVGRLSYWKTAINMGNDSPLMGHGMGNFEHLSRQYQVAGNYVTNPHNVILKIYAELGVIGCLLFIAFIAGIIFAAFKRFGQDKDIEPLLLLVAFIAIFLHGLIDLDFNSPSVLSIFVLMAVFILLDMVPEAKGGRKIDFVLKGLVVTLVVVATFCLSYFPLIAYKYGKEAEAASNSQALTKAVELAEASVDYWPIDPMAQYRLSRFYIGQYEISHDDKDLQKAIQTVQLAIALNPKHPEFYHGLADVYSMTGKQQDILEAIRKSAELYPRSVYYSSEYARALSMNGLIDKAVEVLDKSLEVQESYLANRNPNGMDLVSARFLKASILAGNKRYKEAKEEVGRLLDLLDKPTLVINSYTSSRKTDAGVDKFKKEARSFMADLDKVMKLQKQPDNKETPDKPLKEMEDESDK